MSNKVSRILGKDENNRFLHLSIFQGNAEKKKLMTVVCILSHNCYYCTFVERRISQAMAASENPLLNKPIENDPILFCTAYKRSRFYLFGQSEPERQVKRTFNEPTSPALIVSTVMPIARALTEMSIMNDRRERSRLWLLWHLQSKGRGLLISLSCIPTREIFICVSSPTLRPKLSRTLWYMRERAIMTESFSTESSRSLSVLVSVL